MKKPDILLRRLIMLRSDFTPAATAEKESILISFLKLKQIPSALLIEIHDLLLFLHAYPSNERIARLADVCLVHLEQYLLRGVKRKSPKVAKAIDSTGVTGSKVVATFSFDLIMLLCESFPEAVKYDSCAIDAEEFFTLLNSFLPSPLRENFMEGGWNTVDDWLEAITGKDRHRQLKLLMTLFCESGLPRAQRDLLFDRLQIYIDADLSLMPSRSNIIVHPQEMFFHSEGILRKFDVHEIIHTPIEEDHAVSIDERKRLVSAVRWTLFALFRETDPGTYADLHDVRVFNCGRGLQIVLLGMKQDRRNPVDAYIGFMAFKNGCPYAYGGAWMLGPMAKIGINIFPAYRGGESAWFFAQLMRVYQQVFHPEYFVAEPYQVGRDNPEGIETGAFWFYYRLGYRPLQPALRKLAAGEFEKLKSGKIKKTPAAVLRKLVADELVWAEPGKEKMLKGKFDTAQLSTALFTAIRKRYKGDLMAFRRDALRSMQPDVFAYAEGSLLGEILPALCDYVYASGGTKGWTKDECDALHRLMLEKTRGMDSAYAQLLAQHQRLCKQLMAFTGKEVR